MNNINLNRLNCLINFIDSNLERDEHPMMFIPMLFPEDWRVGVSMYKVPDSPLLKDEVMIDMEIYVAYPPLHIARYFGIDDINTVLDIFWSTCDKVKISKRLREML